ncbi:MAG: hypothetical protein IPI43_27435 [Sandaracinaceae bacterium]|nr:hypothetical protein [Sandaracinaceae bacterium]
MDVARLNMSHGDHPAHRKTIRSLKEPQQEAGQPGGALDGPQGPGSRVS